VKKKEEEGRRRKKEEGGRRKEEEGRRRRRRTKKEEEEEEEEEEKEVESPSMVEPSNEQTPSSYTWKKQNKWADVWRGTRGRIENSESEGEEHEKKKEKDEKKMQKRKKKKKKKRKKQKKREENNEHIARVRLLQTNGSHRQSRSRDLRHDGVHDGTLELRMKLDSGLWTTKSKVWRRRRRRKKRKRKRSWNRHPKTRQVRNQDRPIMPAKKRKKKTEKKETLQQIQTYR
jgi:hypothetical protein